MHPIEIKYILDSLQKGPHSVTDMLGDIGGENLPGGFDITDPSVHALAQYNDSRYRPGNRGNVNQALNQLHGGFWNQVGASPAPTIPNLSGSFWNATGPHDWHAPQAAIPNAAVPPIVNPQVAPQAKPEMGGLAGLLAALNAPHGRHLGIGGAEVTPDNPYGNPGGDPFKNGFFKHDAPMPGMAYLGGTVRPDATQLGMIAAMQKARTTSPMLPVAAGDPQARAFWGAMGAGRRNGAMPF